MATFIAGAAGVNFDDLVVSDLLLGDVVLATPTAFTLQDGAWREEFTGSFTYANNQLSGGTVTGWKELFSGQTVFELTGASVPATTLALWASTNANETARSTIFSGADSITGSAAADRMYGYGGNDSMIGAAGVDYLRGNDGNDSVSGGDAFDDVHGNMGADTVDGGAGADWVRGGQGDDSLLGGEGNDFLSGDRGSDTLAGGLGADLFSTFGEAGADRIVDFSLAEGDRLRVEAGYSYTTAQVGADVVVSVSGGAQVTLVGVQLSSLGNDWIFGG